MFDNINFNQFDINTYDIWFVESNLFILGKRNEEIITELKERYEDLILEHLSPELNRGWETIIEPIVSIEEFYDESKKDVWVKHYEKLNLCKSLKEKIHNNYFYLNSRGVEAYVSYNQSIKLTKSYLDFEYWFAYKLSQYDSGLKYISEFLDYHFENNFDSNYLLFQEFIKNNLLQYKNEIISDKVCTVAEDWIKANLIVEDIAPDSKTKKDSDTEPPYMSFYSKKLHKIRIQNLVELQSKMDDLYKFMNKEKFIKDSSGKRLMDLFTKEKLAKNQPIIWFGSAYELKKFTELIGKIGVSECIKPRSADKWTIVKNCFHVKLSGKEIGVIKNSNSISGAKPTKKDKIEEIKVMVDKIKAMSEIEVNYSK